MGLLWRHGNNTVHIKHKSTWDFYADMEITLYI